MHSETCDWFNKPVLLLSRLSGQSTMDAIIRCPFLSRVPQTFLQQARKSLVAYAVKCPVMMDLASRPLVRSLCSTSSSFQKVENTTPAGDGQYIQPLLVYVWSSVCLHALLKNVPFAFWIRSPQGSCGSPRASGGLNGRLQMPVPGRRDGSEEQQRGSAGQHGSSGGCFWGSHHAQRFVKTCVLISALLRFTVH